MTADEPTAFNSLSALQQASDQLIESVPEDDSPASDLEAEECSKRIMRFLDRATSTGAVLDAPRDRRAAQALIDFWVAKSYAIPGDSRLRRSVRPSISLNPFHPATMDSAIRRGNEVINSLDNKGKQLAQRLLFRLLRFPDRGDDFSSVPASRDELRKFGSKEQVDKLLDDLGAAGIVNDEDGMVTFGYLALTRRWEWLNAKIKKRMNLRDLALSWVGSNRSRGALLSWWLAWRYREFSNLNDWEHEFLNQSSRYGAAKLFLGIVLACAVPVGGLQLTSWYRNVYAPKQVLTVTNEILDKVTSLTKKIDDIKWLAINRQRIAIPAVDLSTAETKDLSGISASGSIFKDSKLTAVNFNNASLAGVSFEASVLVNVTFRQAYLYRTSFDAADFCGKIDFTGADVFKSSFRRARFFDENVPIFDNAAWWQAYGWGFDEIAVLGKYYGRDRITESEAYKANLTVAVNKLKEANNTYARAHDLSQREQALNQRAEALNQKAWTLAIYGVVSDGIAESAAREALKLMDESTKKSADTEASLDDTLAYILMQEGEEDLSKRAKNLEEAVSRLASSTKLSNDGDKLFRYAVALHASNKDGEAMGILADALGKHKYEPSHELYLLGGYMTGGFKQAVMEETGMGSRTLPKRCPPPPNNAG